MFGIFQFTLQRLFKLNDIDFLMLIILMSFFSGIQGHWSPDSYLFYNIVYMGCVLWAIHQTENEKPAQLVRFSIHY